MDDDLDRAAILARRQRFIAMALGGFSAGCRPAPPVEPAPPVAASAPYVAPEPKVLVPAPECPAPPDEPLATPVVDETLDAEQRLEQAKLLYQQGQEAERAGEPDAAIEAFELAYHLIPDKHGFALRIAEAAYEAERYELASEYIEHYLDQVGYQPADYHRDIAIDLRYRLGELGCGPMAVGPVYEPATPEVCLSVCPDPECLSKRERKRRERKKQADARKKVRERRLERKRRRKYFGG